MRRRKDVGKLVKQKGREEKQGDREEQERDKETVRNEGETKGKCGLEERRDWRHREMEVDRETEIK
jgi:hypothetical protein